MARAWVCVLAGLICSVAQAGVQSQLQQALAAGDLHETTFSVMVLDVDSGEELAAICADDPMIPASNMKLITTAAATNILGLDHVFETRLRLVRPRDWAGVQNNANPPGEFGQEKGHVLVVEGDGDPGFCDPVLLSEHGWDTEKLVGVWAQAVLQAGVTQVQSLLVDDRVFDQNFVHPRWPADQLNQWYCAQVTGLNFNDNCLDVYLEPTTPGQTPKTTILPAIPGLELITRAVTGESNAFWVTRLPGTNKLTLWGSVKHRRTHAASVTMHDPPMVFGQVLAHRLAQAGITVRRIARPGLNHRLPQGRVLHTIQTTMPVVLRRCNKDSQNLFAEALLKRIGHEVTGSPGSWENGAAAVRFFLQEHLGANGAAVSISDGSGLSPDNRVTARVLANLLRIIHRNPRTAQTFRETLAVGGADGTLRKRFKRDLTGRVFAKTGYIKGVSALSGYLLVSSKSSPAAADTAPYKTLAFSFLFNNIKPPVYTHKVKQVQEDMLEIIDDWVVSESTKPPAKKD